jgi:hypothetical protein
MLGRLRMGRLIEPRSEKDESEVLLVPSDSDHGVPYGVFPVVE